MKLDRRKFIKYSAVGGGALALPAPLRLAEQKRKPWNRQQARTLRKFRNPRPTTCALCANRCGLITYREGDRVVMLHGNPEHPINHGKLCARAYGQLDRLYDPDRLLKPRVRVGRRGAGQWREISWQEAYKIAVEKLAPYYEGKGAGLALLLGQRGLFDGELRKLFPEAMVVLGDPSYPARQLRRKLFGVSGRRYDFARTRLILNFAADPYTRGLEMVSEVQSLIQGRVENGARLITVAGRLSNTGGRSHKWVPVSPLHYGDLVRAVLYVLAEKNWCDNAALARLSTDSRQLTDMLKPFAPEAVASYIGVEAQEIRRLAHEMVHRRPSLALYDDELLSGPDGWRSAMAVEFLNLVIGAQGAVGGVISYSESDGGLLAAVGIQPGEDYQDAVSLDWFAATRQKAAVINYACNPVFTVCSGGEQNSFWQSSNSVPFHLAIDTHISETSRYADLLLPVATELESWNLSDRLLEDGRRVLSLQQPVSRYEDEILLLRQAKLKNLDILFNESERHPVAESRDYNQIIFDFKTLLNGGKLETAPRVIERVAELLHQPGFKAAGITLTALRQKGYQIYKALEKEKAKTLNLDVSELLPPQPNIEIQGNDQFCLIPYRWHVLDNVTANCKYLAELRHQNPLWIHPRKAQRLGIKEGDEVRIQTSVGSLVAKAWLTEAIHPQCVAIACGLGHTALGRVAQAETIADSDPMTRALLIHKPLHFTPFSFRRKSWDKTEPIWWHNDGSGINIREILRSREVKQLKGLTSFEPLVRIRKKTVG